MANTELVVSVSEFVALLNQTLEFAYPSITIVGELANFRVSKNKWVYFDLKDESSSVKFFATVYQLPGPLEDGMTAEVRGQPRLHSQYGFSVMVAALKPVGEGSLKRAANLLEAKLRAEGLFEAARKRTLPYPPARIGLVTSAEAAAYGDFIKVLAARWGGLVIDFIDVQVQGEAAAGQIIKVIEHFGSAARPPDVLVITRGGGSAEDLEAFNSEPLVRAIAGSRIPTLVAIGHERDISLAELAADARASTPSNAAELLVPDRARELANLHATRLQMAQYAEQSTHDARQAVRDSADSLLDLLKAAAEGARVQFKSRSQMLEALAPTAILARGYAIVSKAGRTLHSGRGLQAGDIVKVRLADAALQAAIEQVTVLGK